MFYQAKQPVISQGLGLALLAALNARPAAALLTTPTLHLMGAPPANALTPQSLVGDFTEASFSGYAAIALATWSTPVFLQQDTPGIIAEATFIAANPLTVTGNVFGYWVSDAGTWTWSVAEVFQTPFAFAQALDFLDLVTNLAEYLRPITG